MKKIELIYREILYNATEKGKFELTQSELSKKFGLSLSVVNAAVKKLEAIGAVKILPRSFKIVDLKKALYYWASIRNFNKDILFKARVEMPVREIERNMPNLMLTAYSAYKFRFNDVPADYSEVYAYADEGELELIKKRFGLDEKNKSSKNPNLFVLKKDAFIEKYGKIPIVQIFTDLWNLKEWYAQEFVKGFEQRLNL